MTFASQQLRLGLFVAMLMLGAGLTLHCQEPVHAQSEDAALLLARVIVNESGFESIDDANAIGSIAIRSARHRNEDLATYLRGRFLRALAPANQRRNRPWIASLSRSLEAPARWPHGSQPWSARRDQWRALLAHVDGLVENRVEMCAAHTWGSPVYDADRIARIVANGGYVVHCGVHTKNVYLRFGGAQ